MVESVVQSHAEIVVDSTEKSKIRVLHVDDELGLLKVAKQCLELQGPFQVDTAGSVEEALNKLKEKEQYDAVVSDYQMPGKDGLEFLEELRKSGNSIPFILFTGKGREEVAIRALNLGADRYLNKVGPPDAVYGELAYSVQDAVDKRRILAKAAHQATLMENVNDAVIGSDENFVIVSWNKAAEEMYGWKAEEAIGKLGSDVLKTEFVSTERTKVIQTLKETGKFRGYMVQYRKDGRTVQVESTAIAVRNGNGVITGYVSVNRDVTERLNMERKLEETNRKLEMILRQASEGIGVVDANETFIFANKAFAEVLGCQENELVGMNVRNFVDEQGFRQVMKQAELRSKGVSSQYELVMHRRNGEPRLTRVSASPLLNEDGSYFGALAVVSDLTEQKKAESELQESEQKFKCLVENSSVAIGITDLKGRLTYLNKALADLFGYSVSELLNKLFMDYLHPKEKGRLTRLFLNAIVLRREPYNFEFRALRKDGQILHLITKPTRLTVNGKTIGFQAIITNITEHKKAEEALRASEERHRVISGITSDFVFSCLKMGEGSFAIDWMTGATEKIFGCSAKEIEDKGCWRFFVHPQDLPTFEEKVTGLKPGQSSVCELRINHKDGSTRWIQVSSKVVEDVSDPANHRLFGACEDITERKKTEDALRESEEKWRSLAENAPNIVMIVDRLGTIHFINRTVVDARPEEIVGKSIYDFVDPEHHNVVKKTIEQVFQTGEGSRYEISGVGPKGSVAWYETHVGPIKRNGQVASVTLITTDFTERKKTEQQLRIKETAVASSINGVAFADLEGKLTYVNSSFLEMWGYANDKEVLGKPAEDFWSSRENAVEVVKALEHKGGWVGELTAKKKDGSTFEVQLSASMVKDKTGKPSCMMVSLIDVTERSEVERKLRESEEKFRNLFQNANDAMIYLDGSGRILDVNRRTVEVFGGTREALKGKQFTEIGIFSIKETPRLMRSFASILAGNTANLDLTIKNKKGQQIDLECSVSVMKSDEATSMVVVARDISERKEAEEELRNSEERLSVLFELAPDACYLSDLKGNFIDGNKAAEKLTGYMKDELIGKSFMKLKLLPRNEALKAAKLLAMNALGKSTGPDELVLNRKDGTQVPVEIRTHPIKIKDKTLVLGIARDITTRKKDERAIRESHQKFEGLFRRNPEAAVHLDVNFKIVDVNPRFCQLFGYSAEEVKGKNINDVVAPEGMREEAESLNKDAKNGYASHNTVRKRKDGSLVPVSISAAPVTFENKLLGYVAIYKDITELKRAQEESEESRRHFQMLFDLMADPVAVVDGRGKILEVTQKVEEITGFKKEELVGKNLLKVKMFGAKTKAVMIKSLAKRMMGMHVEPYEVEVLKKDGGKLLYEINAAKIDYKGKPADLVVFRDILDRKNLEEKLRVVGSLTRHDVRNKLSAVTGNAYLLKRKLAGNPEALEQLADMENAVRSVEAIFEFARTYEKLGVEQLANLNVGKAVDEAASLFPDLKGVNMVNECGGLTVLADSLLRQLFYNLIDDSLKYGEKLTQIRVRYEEFEDKLKLIYEDDGVGISKDAKHKLFNEGYTTGKGSGYGLYLVRRMMDVYGWTIDETGVPGKGAQFTIDIPKAKPDRRQNYKLS
ncbi:PAS domain S-box protein [Candidatus Bathyarchaeota archaeon]|nr:PAS domain S-box protein [Candidatus Bathyarchaeota archaeon]